MSAILTAKPGTITVINYSDYLGVGIFSISGMPSNQAIILNRFVVTAKARHAVSYSLANVPYLYVFGTSLTDLDASFYLFPYNNCAESGAIYSFLEFVDGNLVSAYGSPRINVTVGGASWRGVIHQMQIESGVHQQSPEIAAGTISATGNFL